MPARTPEEVDTLFAQALNAGDLDALVALYEPAAALAPEPGKVVHGSAAIREALAGFLAMKPQMRIAARLLAQSNELALVAGVWELEGTGADGGPVRIKGESIEVVRRQREGHWLFAIDNPWGLQGA